MLLNMIIIENNILICQHAMASALHIFSQHVITVTDSEHVG